MHCFGKLNDVVIADGNGNRLVRCVESCPAYRGTINEIIVKRCRSRAIKRLPVYIRLRVHGCTERQRKRCTSSFFIDYHVIDLHNG